MLFISDLPKFSAGTELVMTISIGLVAIVLLALGAATVYNALRERRRMKIEDAEEGKRQKERKRYRGMDVDFGSPASAFSNELRRPKE